MCLPSVYITRKKSTANLRLIDNLIVSPDTPTVQGDLYWLTGLYNSGSFWVEAAIDCLRAISGWLVSNVATRILIRTYKFSTANRTLPPLCTFSEPLTPFCRTLGFLRTQFEKHCSIPCKYRISSQQPRRYRRACKQNVSTYSDMTIMCYSHVLLSNKSSHRAENSHSNTICPVTDTGTHPGPMNFPKTAKDSTQRNTLTRSRNQLSSENTMKRNGVHQYSPTAAIPEITGCMRLDDVRQELKRHLRNAIRLNAYCYSGVSIWTWQDGWVGWSIIFGQSSNEEWTQISRKHLISRATANYLLGAQFIASLITDTRHNCTSTSSAGTRTVMC
jgi:hypothetical protein